MFGNDTIALGFIIRMMEIAPEVLQQLGYIGFDDEVADTLFKPSVSTMVVDFKSITKDTLYALTHLDDEDSVHEIHAKHILKERNSSKKR